MSSPWISYDSRRDCNMFCYIFKKQVDIDELVAGLKKIDGLKLKNVSVQERADLNIGIYDKDEDIGRREYTESKYSIEDFYSGKVHRSAFGSGVTLEGTWKEKCVYFQIDEGHITGIPMFYVYDYSKEFMLPENFEELIPAMRLRPFDSF